MVPTSRQHKLPLINTCLLLAIGLVEGCGAEAPQVASMPMMSATAQPSATSSESQQPGKVAEVERKIIYEAQLRLVVPDFASTEESIPRLIKEHGGYLSQSSIDRTSGEHRSGIWQARIPVDQFEAFLDGLSALGVPEHRSQTAQDVTEEFVDLEARISNKQRLEKRILELLDKADEKIKDIIEVERELARVRSEIEQMEGRLRYLTNQTDLTTVTIFAREQLDYVPPETPSFLSRTKQTWSHSLIALQEFSEGLAVVIVFVFPWLAALSVFVLPVMWFVRRRKARSMAVAVKKPPVTSTRVDEEKD